MISDEYLAGLLDGEGTIGIRHRPRCEKGRPGEMQSHIVVAFTMCDREPLDAIAERFGGNVYKLKTSNGWRHPYRWQAFGPGGEALLKAVRPYLLVKGKQADVALEFRSTLMMGGRATAGRADYNASVLARRLELRELMGQLNQRGDTRAA